MERRIDNVEARAALEQLYLDKITQAMISGNRFAWIYYRIRLKGLTR